MILRHLCSKRKVVWSSAGAASSALLWNVDSVGFVVDPFCRNCLPLPSSQERRTLATATATATTKQRGNGKRKDGGRSGNSKPEHRRSGGRGDDRARNQKKDGRRKQASARLAFRPPPNKNNMKRLPMTNGAEPILPPALLAPTASPYVYISQTALVGSDIDPSTLFAEALMVPVISTTTDVETMNASATPSGTATAAAITAGRGILPPLFARGDFEYFSPKRDLGHDYPVHGRPEVAFLGRSNVGERCNSLFRHACDLGSAPTDLLRIHNVCTAHTTKQA
jgi:hypothetical protein